MAMSDTFLKWAIFSENIHFHEIHTFLSLYINPFCFSFEGFFYFY